VLGSVQCGLLLFLLLTSIIISFLSFMFTAFQTLARAMMCCNCNLHNIDFITICIIYSACIYIICAMNMKVLHMIILSIFFLHDLQVEF
jgi:hypothetical protein